MRYPVLDLAEFIFIKKLRCKAGAIVTVNSLNSVSYNIRCIHCCINSKVSALGMSANQDIARVLFCNIFKVLSCSLLRTNLFKTYPEVKSPVINIHRGSAKRHIESPIRKMHRKGCEHHIIIRVIDVHIIREL